ncbi:MAG: polysaccharide deacetylase family protein [Candidatus Nanopelagicales bacterium]|nr:polysaccharide deacetylase family protein [Candidatus Nanopelagicales bacterium]
MRSPDSSRLVPVLLYHHVVAGRPDEPWAIGSHELRRQLQMLAATGAATFTASDYANRCRSATLPETPLAMVTFDDAHAGVVDLALPILQELGLRATFFVTTGFLGKPDNISASALRGLAGTDLEIGSHSIGHPQLDVISEHNAWIEIARSRAILEDLIGSAVTSFSYPHGYHGPVARRLVERAGYETAHAVKNSFSYVGDDLLAVARLTVLADTPTAVVGEWINRCGAPIARRSEAARTRLWRRYRRTRMRLGHRTGQPAVASTEAADDADG